MTIPAYLRRIGRGASGARPLGVDEADDLMARLLDGRASPMQLGAVALAMRMKGETADELIGFARAAARGTVMVASDRPVVVVASPNGARRLPNLVALLALALARDGRRVLVHGPTSDPGRVTTAEVLAALGHPIDGGLAAAGRAWSRGAPAFVATAALNPPLGSLLRARAELGVRNSGHTVAKLLNPVVGAPSLRLAAHTHPEFGVLLRDVAARTGATMQLLRGTEGEPVADLRRRPALDTFVAGVHRPELSCEAQGGALAPTGGESGLPSACDAASTAGYVRDVLDGRLPMPTPLAAQLALLGATLDALASPASSDSPSPTTPSTPTTPTTPAALHGPQAPAGA